MIDLRSVRHAQARSRRHEIVGRDEIVYHTTRWSNRNAIFKRIVIEDPARKARFLLVERVAKLTLSDFRFMFALCGLELESTYGDYSFAPFDADTSDRLIFVAPKREESDLAAGHRFANAADRLRCHAEVGGEHGLGYAEGDGWVDPQEFPVALLCRSTQRTDDALVFGCGVTLQTVPERDRVARHQINQVPMRRRVDQQEIGVFDGIDEE